MDVTAATPPPGPRPRARGWSHLGGALVAALSVPLFVARAADGAPAVGAGVFAAAVVVCFGTSAAYHVVDWEPPWSLRMKRADHVGIFVLLAGTYTGVAVVVLDGWFRVAMLTVAWAAVAFGVVAASFGLFELRGAANASYIALGWLAIVMLPAMLDHMNRAELGLLLAGGVLYTGGAVALAQRVPALWPRVFGYHEFWHVLTLVAAACHAAVVWSITAA